MTSYWTLSELARYLESEHGVHIVYSDGGVINASSYTLYPEPWPVLVKTYISLKAEGEGVALLEFSDRGETATLFHQWWWETPCTQLEAAASAYGASVYGTSVIKTSKVNNRIEARDALLDFAQACAAVALATVLNQARLTANAVV